MAKVRITVIEAFDSTSGSMMGTMVRDMFNALAKGVVESTNADDIVDAGLSMCEACLALNPGRSAVS